jgi:4-hydroxy-tetrahydrodipicolinate synthase
MSRLPSPFGGIVPPVCTPFTEDNEVDVPSLERLSTFLLDGGVHGLFMLGSTGEMACLTDAQRRTVLEVAVRVAGGRVPVLAGVIDLTTARCIEQARAARKAGVDGLVLTAPFYIRPSQAEVLDHFRQVHAAVDLPLFAYDLPSVIQTKLERATVAQLAREGVLAGIKDSSGDDANFRGVVLDSAATPGFATFTGSELLVDAALMIGASGSVPGLGNVDPAGYARIYNAARAGDWAAARREQDRLYHLFAIIRAATPGRMGFIAGALGGFKTALMLRGVIATNVPGRPMTRLNDEETARIRALLVEAELI